MLRFPQNNPMRDDSKVFRHSILSLVVAVSVGSLITLVSQRLWSRFRGNDSSDSLSANDTKRFQELLNNEKKEYPINPDLIDEQLARNRAFFGDEGLQKIRNSYIIVVGLGGVGSWAATMLVRSGVGKIRVIDFDQVTLSSLNRHAVAGLDDVGRSKVDCFKAKMKQIAPWVQVDAVNALWTKYDAERLLDTSADFVIDAIDNVETKTDLLTYCKQNGLEVVSSMGAGCKSDPTRILMADISQTDEDPLSRVIRRRLRLNGIDHGIPTVFSSEKPGDGKATLLPLDEDEFQKGKVSELGILPNFRARILPVLGTIPAIFGLVLANYILTFLGGYPVQMNPFKERNKLYGDIYVDLCERYSNNGGLIDGQEFPLSLADVAYVMEEVFHGRSCLPPYNNARNLTLCEWKVGEGMVFGNIVVMTKEEFRRHERLLDEHNGSHIEAYGQDTVARVEDAFRMDRYFRQWR